MAITHSHHLFETPLGWMGLAWSDQGLTRVLTPQRDRQDCERRLMRFADGETKAVETVGLPQFVAKAVDLLTRYAAGETIFRRSRSTLKASSPSGWTSMTPRES